MFKPFGMGGPPGPAGMDPMFKPGGAAATPGIIPQPEEEASGLSGLLGGLKEGFGKMDKNKAAMMMSVLSNGFGNMTLRGNGGLKQMNNAIFAQANKNITNNKSMEYLKTENPALHAQLMKLPEGVRDQYMGVVFEKMLKPEESFSAATPEQLAQFGIPTDENGMPADGKVYQVSSTTGKLSAVGGGGQNIQITNESDRDDQWMTHLVDTDINADKNLRESGANAFDSIYELDNLGTALSALDSTGEWEKTKADFSRIASKFGIPVNEEFLERYDTAEAAANALVANELRKNKGPQTDFDAQFATSYTASPDKLGGTNQSIMNHKRGMAARNQFISNLYQNELSTIDRDDVQGQRAAVRKWDREFNNVPTVIPKKNLPDGNQVASYFTPDNIHFDGFVEIVQGNPNDFGTPTDAEIFEAWKELVALARR